MAKKSPGGKRKSGNKKHGRNIVGCQHYKARGRREANKARKLHKHIRDHPNDGVAARSV